MIVFNPYDFENNKFDIVIIGAGPAGISLALSLAKKKFKIALIEAGEKKYSVESQEFYKGSIEGDFPRELHVSRLRMFGGTTGHWGGSCRTLDEYDYEKWPIRKNDLEPYLKKSTEILNIKSEFREIPLTQKLKLIEFQISKVRFAEKFFNSIEKSKNIYLFLNSPVISVEGQNNKVSNVICYSKKNKKFQINGELFVLATGGIENSRLLLLINLKNKYLFNQEIPIGNYWYEHPFNELGKAILKKNKVKNILKNDLNHFVNFRNGGDNSITYNFSPTKNLINEKKILNSCIWIVLHERSYKDWDNIAKNLACVAPNLSNKFLELFKKKLSCDATIYSSWEQDPEYNNRITLSLDKKDNFGLAQAKIVYKKSELVRKTARICMEEIGKYLINKDLGRLVANSFLFDKKEKYLSEAGWHHMGGTIMGQNSKNSVVDKNLKIHGSRNMFVIGSSVFPTGGHANPTLTIVQLSLRLANNIYENFKKI